MNTSTKTLMTALAMGATTLLLTAQSFSENLTLNSKYELWKNSSTYLRGVHLRSPKPPQPDNREMQNEETEAPRPKLHEHLKKLSALGANLIHITLPPPKNDDQPEREKRPGGPGRRPDGERPDRPSEGDSGDRPENGDRPDERPEDTPGENDRPENGDRPDESPEDRPQRPPLLNSEEILKSLEDADLFAVISFGLPHLPQDQNNGFHPKSNDVSQPEVESEAPEFNEEAWINMWQETANRLKGKTFVAAYDLRFMPRRRPQPTEGIREESETPEPPNPKELYSKLITAIRSIDSHTPIIIGNEIMTPEDETLDLSAFTDDKLVFTFRKPRPANPEDEESDVMQVPLLDKISQYLDSNTIPLTICGFGVNHQAEDATTALQDQLTFFEEYHLNHAFAPRPLKPETNRANDQEEEQPENDTSIPEILQTNWQLNTIRPSNTTFTSAPEGTTSPETITEDYSEELNIAPGMIIEIAAEQVGLESFSKRPKVYVTSGKKNIKVPVLTKITSDTPATTITCVWRAPVRLLKKKQQKGQLLSEITLQSTVLGVLKVEVAGNIISTNTAIVLNNPVISSIETNDDQYTITGNYFGEKPPVTLLELTTTNGKTKYKRCKLIKETSLNYMNALQKENRSCMKIIADDVDDNEVGYSQITVTFPPLKDDESTTGNIIVLNKTGLAVYNLND